MDRKATKNKHRYNTLKNTLNQFDILGLCKSRHQTTSEYIYILSTHRQFIKIDLKRIKAQQKYIEYVP